MVRHCIVHSLLHNGNPPHRSIGFKPNWSKSHCVLQTVKFGQGNSLLLSKFRTGVAPQSSHRMTRNMTTEAYWTKLQLLHLVLTCQVIVTMTNFQEIVISTSLSSYELWQICHCHISRKPVFQHTWFTICYMCSSCQLDVRHQHKKHSHIGRLGNGNQDLHRFSFFETG
jgi:hypothetical protein